MKVGAEIFEDYSIEEIKQGFIEDQKGYTCIICGKRFEKGEVYNFYNRLYEGKKAVTLHIKQQHESIRDILLNIKAHDLGISDLQLQLLNFFAQGLSDKEIADLMGVSVSTIRNHRYKLRERERQNKLFVTLMDLLKQDKLLSRGTIQGGKSRLEIGELLMVSEKERKCILDQYMTDSGRLKEYPRYEKSKKVILEAILVNFCKGTKYAEEEVNRILESIYQDYKLLKRELIAYNYLDRTNTGAIYWVKNFVQTTCIEGTDKLLNEA